jgi:hypothetical protein
MMARQSSFFGKDCYYRICLYGNFLVVFRETPVNTNLLPSIVGRRYNACLIIVQSVKRGYLTLAVVSKKWC